MSVDIIIGVGGSGIRIGQEVLRCFERTKGWAPLLLAVDADVHMQEVPPANQFFLGGIDIELIAKSAYTTGWPATN